MTEHIDFEDLNTMSSLEFIDVLADIFEHSPWVAERVVDRRPFTSVRSLHQAMTEEVSLASEREQRALIRAHPDLAGKAALEDSLTEASTGEQQGAGLDRLSDEELARITALNADYKSRFGFPFILAVKGHDKHSILATFEKRLENDEDAEQREGLRQISEIARLRLNAMLHHDNGEDDGA